MDLMNFEQVSVFCSKILNMPHNKTKEAECTIKKAINAISEKAKETRNNSSIGLYVALIEKIKNRLSISFPFLTNYANEKLNCIAETNLIENPSKLGTILFSSQLIEGCFDSDILLESATLLYRYNNEYFNSTVFPYMIENGLESYIPYDSK
ncbi:hypothetical protein PIROE2DRAFT_17766 [Piromyces sp. E2]|nr:hypothetical protein PIROE2DRAFT_17766 [Piromyces sp. E2]|eukprot:OUM57298.1 hypothetical protein PIROE2DRAFT_17766 [Piromyces sp. E2]